MIDLANSLLVGIPLWYADQLTSAGVLTWTISLFTFQVFIVFDSFFFFSLLFYHSTSFCSIVNDPVSPYESLPQNKHQGELSWSAQKKSGLTPFYQRIFFNICVRTI